MDTLFTVIAVDQIVRDNQERLGKSGRRAEIVARKSR